MVSMWTIVGALALVSSSIGYFAFPDALKMGISSTLNLAENGPVLPVYMNPSSPSMTSYYIYTIRNPKGVLTGGKAEFDLKGPYYYEAWVRRDNITFSPDGERVKYHTHRMLILNEEKSEDLDEKHWLLNLILPSASRTIQSLVLYRVPFRPLSEPIIFNIVNLILDTYNERLISRKSARELLQGKKIDMLEAMQRLANILGLDSLIPPGPPENVFGIAHSQNSSVQVIEIFTGIGKTKSKFADVYKYKDQEKMECWSGSCNAISGTNGELYRPFMIKGKPLKVFLGIICRSLYLDPVSVIEIQDGLIALEYEVSSRLFLGVRNNPKNKCFCQDLGTYDCQYDGLLNMGPCLFNLPLFFSKANMKGVDRRIRSLVNETTIEFDIPEKQSVYIDQITGIILKVNFSVLSMIKVVRQPNMRDMASIQDLTYIPYVLVHEQVEAPHSLTRPLKYLQIMMAYYKEAFMAGAAGGAAFLLLKFTIFRFNQSEGQKFTKIDNSIRSMKSDN